MKKIHSINIILMLCTLFSFSCNEKTAQNTTEKLNPKVWLHRSNSIEKTAYYRDKYAGFEIDVQFVDSTRNFIIRHGGFDESSNLPLDEWLQALDRKKEANLWLDFKNLSKKNENEALEEIKRLRKKHRLKGTIYIESSHPECLKCFEDAGFSTSYYIPAAFPGKASDENMKKVTNIVRKNIAKYGLKTISGYCWQFEFMVDSFPDVRKLTWYEVCGDKRDYYIEKATQDDKTDIILIAVPDTVDYKKALENKQPS